MVGGCGVVDGATIQARSDLRVIGFGHSKLSARSNASSESYRGSKAEQGATGSNLTAVNPSLTYSAAPCAARPGSK